MKMPIGLTLFLMAGACFSADAYQWVDEKGVINYGEKPPVSRQAKPVNTNPDNLRNDIVKTDYYFPTPANPYTTVVTLRGVRIFELDRLKTF